MIVKLEQQIADRIVLINLEFIYIDWLVDYTTL